MNSLSSYELRTVPNCDELNSAVVSTTFYRCYDATMTFTRVSDVLVDAPPLSGHAFVRRLIYLRQTGSPAAIVVSATAASNLRHPRDGKRMEVRIFGK